jgi:hypothetical protein
MLSTTAFAPGEVSLRELMLGLIAVAVFVGIVVGRNTERARRTYKDWDAAKVALKKGRGIALARFARPSSPCSSSPASCWPCSSAR